METLKGLPSLDRGVWGGLNTALDLGRYIGTHQGIPRPGDSE